MIYFNGPSLHFYLICMFLNLYLEYKQDGERKRIEACTGGHVSNGRVMGNLAVRVTHMCLEYIL